MVQGELFREEETEVNLSRKPNSFLSHCHLTLSLDKLVLVFIGFVIAFSVVYSFGVERGKRSVEKRFEDMIPAHSATLVQPKTSDEAGKDKNEVVLNVKSEDPQVASQTSQTETTESAQTEPQESAPLAMDLSGQMGKYTIQLVTYANQQQASQEVDRLKSDGHEGFIIPSGKYYQVCANIFENKKEAKDVLNQVKSTGRYPDAYIRPVVR